jgi:hypothetical protein
MSKDRKTITEKLTWACVMYWAKRNRGVYTELGLKQWGRRRADVVCLSLKGEIIICEVKSCLADFKSDVKYLEYLSYCHKMFFCVKDKDIFDDLTLSVFEQYGIGILELDKTTGYLKVVLKAKKRKMKKKEKRDILYRMAWRSATYSKRTGVRRMKTFI